MVLCDNYRQMWVNPQKNVWNGFEEKHHRVPVGRTIHRNLHAMYAPFADPEIVTFLCWKNCCVAIAAPSQSYMGMSCIHTQFICIRFIKWYLSQMFIIRFIIQISNCKWAMCGGSRFVLQMKRYLRWWTQQSRQRNALHTSRTVPEGTPSEPVAGAMGDGEWVQSPPTFLLVPLFRDSAST